MEILVEEKYGLNHKFTKLGFLVLIVILVESCGNGIKNDSIASIPVEARIWSKVEGRPVYSDWTEFRAITTGQLEGFVVADSVQMGIYGSRTDRRVESEGYFSTMKIGERWWIVDPLGFLNLSVAVTGFRPGTSERNKSELVKRYGSEYGWVTQARTELLDLGFNGTGAWSNLPLVTRSNDGSKRPLVYVTIWNFYQSYHAARPGNSVNEVSFSVFDQEFERFVDEMAIGLKPYMDDPNLLGHFSDNELAFKLSILDEFLAVEDSEDPNRWAAENFLSEMGLEQADITDSVRVLFQGVAADRYYDVVSGAIKRNDPNHMYLGSRLHGKPKNTEAIVKAAGRYVDILSVNYYGEWEPLKDHFSNWNKWVDKPVMITEFYTKGMDSGLPNNTGAGWIVKTQDERGIHYENFCLNLLQMENCVGWHWFRYMDNDPTDLTADPSNNDSNKGLVDNYYRIYEPLASHMKAVNINRYRLVDYFDRHN